MSLHPYSMLCVPIKALFDYIESGEIIEEFLENFPTVGKEQAIEVLELARKSISTEKNLNENLANTIS